jgi:hypothetical protein
MIPKKATKLYSQVSEDLDLDENLVETFLEFYYKEIRTLMSNLEYPRLNIDGLGHFVVKSYSVNRAIARYSRSLENHDTSTFGAYYNKKMMETRLDLLMKVEKKILEEEQRKLTFKKIKYESSSKDNLAE